MVKSNKPLVEYNMKKTYQSYQNQKREMKEKAEEDQEQESNNNDINKRTAVPMMNTMSGPQNFLNEKEV